MPTALLSVETSAVRGVGASSTVAGSRSPSAGWAGSAPTPILISVAEHRGRVVLADDDVLLRECVASLLIGSGFDVVGRAGDPAELLALVRSHRPDLVVVDIRMPPTRTTEGLEAAQVIRRELPETAILVLSAHIEVEQATELLGSGRRTGCLPKDRISDGGDFPAPLDRILKGAVIVDPPPAQELFAARRIDDPLQDLSPRER